MHAATLEHLPESEGWKLADVKVELPGHTPFHFTMWHRDTAEYVRKQYGHTSRDEGFVYESDVGQPGMPWGASIWVREEAAVRDNLGSHAFIAALQMYSDATCVNVKQLSFHPVYATLLNRPHSIKVQCIDAVAFIPMVPQQKGLSDENNVC